MISNTHTGAPGRIVDNLPQTYSLLSLWVRSHYRHHYHGKTPSSSRRREQTAARARRDGPSPPRRGGPACSASPRGPQGCSSEQMSVCISEQSSIDLAALKSMRRRPMSLRLPCTGQIVEIKTSEIIECALFKK
jgi:hypothetical protein